MPSSRVTLLVALLFAVLLGGGILVLIDHARPTDIAFEVGREGPLSESPDSEASSGAASSDGDAKQGVTREAEATSDAVDDVAAAGTTDPGLPDGMGAVSILAVQADGSPVPGTRILLMPSEAERVDREARLLVTDEAGRADAVGVRPGRVRLDCSIGPREDAVVVAGQWTDVRLEFTGGVEVQGTVRGPDGLPVSGATIWVASFGKSWRANAEVAHSDAEGAFVVRFVRPTDSLGATAEGYAPSALVDLELVRVEASRVQLTLELQEGGGSLRGRVLNPEGDAIEGARVAVGESPSGYNMRNDLTREESWCARSTLSDDQGRFAIHGVKPGVQPLRVAASDYPVHSGSVEIVRGREAVQDVHMEHGVSVTGVVRDEAGDVVAEAVVLALDEPFVDPFPMQGPTERGAPFHRPMSRSGADGRFHLAQVPSGDLHLYAAKGISYLDSGDYRGMDQRTLDGDDGASLTWDPVLTRGGVIQGRVVYSNDAPISGVFVSATDEDGQRFTSHTTPEGAFSIPGLKDAAYRVSVQLWDQPDDASPLEMEEVWPSETELLLRASYAKVSQQQGKVLVRIDDRAQRLSGQGGVILAHDRGWYFSEEVDGVFQVSLRPGRYQARVVMGDLVVGAGPWFDLAEGEERDLGSVQTRPSAQLVVRVSRPPELARTPIFVQCTPEDTGRTELRTLAEGDDEVVFEELMVGTVQLRVAGQGLADETRTVELSGSEETLIEFHPVRPEMVNLVIEASQSAGFGKLTLTVRGVDGQIQSQQDFHESDDLRLPVETVLWLPPGRFTLEASTAGGLSAHEEVTVSPAEEAPRVVLTLR